MGRFMDEKGFAGYLNDHLAGSEVALKVADRLLGEHADDAIGAFMRRFRNELEQERAAIRTALDLLDQDESMLARSVGIVGGLLTWVRDAAPIGNAPPLLEELEALAIGVWGKRLLWGTVARATAYDARFEALDADRLALQAEDQERELLRLRGEEIDRGLRLGEVA
jgi:hypothetical protein